MSTSEAGVNPIGSISITLFLSNSTDFVKLPVIPDQIEIHTGLANNTAEVVGLGEVGMIGNMKLTTVTLSSFFPRSYSPICQIAAKELEPPYTLIERIISWMKLKKPVSLIISGMGVDKMTCMIEEFSYREKGGQPGDVYYDLVLKEYREMKPRIKTLEDNRVKVKSSRTESRTIPDKYTVKSGDCLYTIAKRFYGSGSKWGQLYEKNEKIIGKNPNQIKPGQVLKL